MIGDTYDPKEVEWQEFFPERAAMLASMLWRNGRIPRMFRALFVVLSPVLCIGIIVPWACLHYLYFVARRIWEASQEVN